MVYYKNRLFSQSKCIIFGTSMKSIFFLFFCDKCVLEMRLKEEPVYSNVRDEFVVFAACTHHSSLGGAFCAEASKEDTWNTLENPINTVVPISAPAFPTYNIQDYEWKVLNRWVASVPIPKIRNILKIVFEQIKKFICKFIESSCSWISKTVLCIRQRKNDNFLSQKPFFWSWVARKIPSNVLPIVQKKTTRKMNALFAFICVYHSNPMLYLH